MQPMTFDHNIPVFTVSELSEALKRTVESAFSHVRVRGEISGFKRAASGHLYFTLKDMNSIIDGVCWRGTSSRLAVNPEDGIEVICTGKLTTYGGRSKYQIVIEEMEMAGAGALLALFEKRKKQLAEEGLFGADRKKSLPFLPQKIGVVTSPTGAVIRDILHRLSDRFPIHVEVWPVMVQGKGAAEQIAAAIDGFNALVEKPDLLIVARGGGSLEDLWAFNEEIVVRAAANSSIPLISAVGHETDTTLIDYAADLRAPTPTAAAELASPIRSELIQNLSLLFNRSIHAIQRSLKEHELRLETMMRRLGSPQSYLGEQMQRLDDRAERLDNAIKSHLKHEAMRIKQLVAKLIHPRDILQRSEERVDNLMKRQSLAINHLLRNKKQHFDGLSRLLESYSYADTLKRGFALIKDEKGDFVFSSKAMKAGDKGQIILADGTIDFSRQ
jgi:exodeoxyribonuclease VII large subunit